MAVFILWLSRDIKYTHSRDIIESNEKDELENKNKNPQTETFYTPNPGCRELEQTKEKSTENLDQGQQRSPEAIRGRSQRSGSLVRRLSRKLSKNRFGNRTGNDERAAGSSKEATPPRDLSRGSTAARFNSFI